VNGTAAFKKAGVYFWPGRTCSPGTDDSIADRNQSPDTAPLKTPRGGLRNDTRASGGCQGNAETKEDRRWWLNLNWSGIRIFSIFSFETRRQGTLKTRSTPTSRTTSEQCIGWNSASSILACRHACDNLTTRQAHPLQIQPSPRQDAELQRCDFPTGSPL
jgi:hypothetical protein